MLEYYVLNSAWNAQEVKHFNIFNNWVLEEAVIAEIKKYLRAPSKYKYGEYNRDTSTYDYIYGFDAFVTELRHLIMWQEWSRCEYEIIVADLFDTDGSSQKKIDCFYQCEPNMEMIAREVIYQYKQSEKMNKEKKDESSN